MHVGVVGVQALVDRKPGSKRKIGFVAAAQRLQLERPQQFGQCAAMIDDSMACSAPRARRVSGLRPSCCNSSSSPLIS